MTARYLATGQESTNINAEAQTGDDRCDRCNAASKLRLTLVSGGELAFCGHHANRYAEDLVKVTVQYAADEGFEWRGADLIEAAAVVKAKRPETLADLEPLSRPAASAEAHIPKHAAH